MAQWWVMTLSLGHISEVSACMVKNNFLAVRFYCLDAIFCISVDGDPRTFYSLELRSCMVHVQSQNLCNRSLVLSLFLTWIDLAAVFSIVAVEGVCPIRIVLMKFGNIGITLSVRSSIRLSRVNLTLALTFETKENWLSYYTCVFLLKRPFRPYQKFWPCDLDLEFWPTFERA